MPGLDGLTATSALRAAVPSCRVLVVTTFGRPGYLRRALEAGASGFVVKDTPARQLADAVRRVHAGLRVVDPALAAESLAAGSTPLTARETEVLRAARDGGTVADLAAALHLSEGTVRNHLSRRSARRGRAPAPRPSVWPTRPAGCSDPPAQPPAIKEFLGIKEFLRIKESRDAVRQVRALTPAAPPAHSGLMSRALVALAGASLLALLLGLGRSPHPAAAVALALLFTALATAGFAWVRSRGPRIRAAYFAVQLPLGVLVFGLAGATTGGGLLLVVLVVQAVLVLPLGWAVVVAALMPLAHVGMAGSDAVREGVGMLAARGLRVRRSPLLHVREQQARAELAVANEQLRELRRAGRAAGDRTRSATGWPATSTTGSATT